MIDIIMHKATILSLPDNLISVLAKVPDDRGKNIFALPPTKTAEFEVTNRYESSEKQTKTFTVYIPSVIFQRNKVRSS